MEFAVSTPDCAEGQGRWVVAVDAAGERFLTADDTGTFIWYAISECTLLKLVTPEMPRPVLPVQPRPPAASKLDLPPTVLNLRNGGN